MDYQKTLAHFERWGLLNFPTDELTQLADKYGSDKGLLHPNPHYYTYHYSKLLRRLRSQPLGLLEIGLLNKVRQDKVYGNRSYAGTYSGLGRDAHADVPSLRMWSDYLPNAQITGIDIHDFSRVSIERCKTFICDQSDPAALKKVLSSINPPDLVIDDGSHASEHQQVSFFTIFPRLAEGGLYVIEDLQWQPPGIGDPGYPKTLALLEGFPKSLKLSPLYKGSRIEEQIAGVYVMDSFLQNREIAFIFKNGSGPFKAGHLKYQR